MRKQFSLNLKELSDISTCSEVLDYMKKHMRLCEVISNEGIKYASNMGLVMLRSVPTTARHTARVAAVKAPRSYFRKPITGRSFPGPNSYFTKWMKVFNTLNQKSVTVVEKLTNEEPMGAVVVTCLENAHAALLATLPGAMIQVRVDRIKLTLATCLYLSTDGTEVADITRFLEIIELRPFEMRILRLIPIDMNLPVGLLSLCTTYLIILAQFHR
ncbi:hypothetical protein EVAR_32847_1 [Eumeta japonica]|uniref:Uncharacterized protein n=1 Tax=Eumeta variegata TaxID=151549 RepID=A0A4C1WE89_EUMVA|nr:hypothetical protein EVAR_32847_1 [Eumeta japonica]